MNFEPTQENTSLLNIVAAWNKAMPCDVSQWKIVAFAGKKETQCMKYATYL